MLGVLVPERTRIRPGAGLWVPKRGST